MSELFSKFTKAAVRSIGSVWGFLFAAFIIIIWFITGWYFQYAQFWQGIFNLGMSVLTFLLVFIIQHQQNRDSTAINLKLDELILASKKARNKVIDAENLPDKTLKEHKERIIQNVERKIKDQKLR